MRFDMEDGMDIEFVPAYSCREELAELYQEYNALLLSVSDTIGECLAQQNFDEELDHLVEKFGPPAGRLLLCRVDGRAAGCVGIKYFSDEICELKRLYVRPEYRGHALGHKLVNIMLDEARVSGYSYMYLDTLPGLKSAIKLYRAMGFYDIAPYYYNPVPDAVYLGYTL